MNAEGVVNEDLLPAMRAGQVGQLLPFKRCDPRHHFGAPTALGAEGIAPESLLRAVFASGLGAVRHRNGLVVRCPRRLHHHLDRGSRWSGLDGLHKGRGEWGCRKRCAAMNAEAVPIGGRSAAPRTAGHGPTFQATQGALMTCVSDSGTDW